MIWKYCMTVSNGENWSCSIMLCFLSRKKTTRESFRYVKKSVMSVRTWNVRSQLKQHLYKNIRMIRSGIQLSSSIYLQSVIALSASSYPVAIHQLSFRYWRHVYEYISFISIILTGSIRWQQICLILTYHADLTYL